MHVTSMDNKYTIVWHIVSYAQSESIIKTMCLEKPVDHNAVTEWIENTKSSA